MDSSRGGVVSSYRDGRVNSISFHTSDTGTIVVRDDDLKLLCYLTEIEGLELDGLHVKISDKGMKYIMQLRNLRKLTISGAHLSDEGLKQLRGLTKLRFLGLYGTQVTDEGMKHLQGLTKIEYLYLSFTQVTDDGMKYLIGMRNLRSLSVTGTQVTQEGVKNIPLLCKIDL